jgi:bacillolysin
MNFSLVRQVPLSFLVAMALMGVLPAGAAVDPVARQSAETLAYHPVTRQLIFVGAAPGETIPSPAADASALPAEGTSRSHIAAYAHALGLTDPARELRSSRTSKRRDGRTVARYRQVYQDVPVFGSDVIVNTGANGGLLAMSAKLSPRLSLSTVPAVTPEEALEAARLSVAAGFAQDLSGLTATMPELWIYDGRMLGFDTKPAALVWKLEVRRPGAGSNLNVLVLVDAQRGGISLQFNQIDTSWRIDPRAAQPTPPAPQAADAPGPGFPKISVYTMNHSEDEADLPGVFLCDQGDAGPCDGDTDAGGAYRHAGDTYDFYYSKHGRDSLDGAGMEIVSSVHYGLDYDNTLWDEARQQMVYGDGFPAADDVVAHELTHGVTQYESNLIYFGQPGAISESFSDLWGEFVDQTNGTGNDTAAAKWLLGEDLPGMGATRNMKNPPALSDPDKMTSSFYSTGLADNAGVHTNSGVNNKAVYLMVDGGVFNGRTVTPLGLDKTAAIYYEVQTNLLGSGANYLDLYYALYQACVSLIGTDGITASDCQEVRDATDAVQMNMTRSATVYPTVDYCPSGQSIAQVLFTDDFESGSGNWTFGAESGNQLWLLDTANSDASSKVGSLRWDPSPWCPAPPCSEGSDSYAAMSADVVIPKAPTRTYLRFEHDFGFDYDGTSLWDGGVAEYSTDGGGTWKDLAPRYSGGLNYKGTIATAYDNPLGGRKAFAKSTINYTASRYDLSALAEQSIRARFRAGSDNYFNSWGWFVDDVKIYTCVSVPALPALLLPAANKLVYDAAPRLDWNDTVPDTDHYDLQVATDSGFAAIIVDLTGLKTSEYTLPTLDPNKTYYWRLSAHNVIEQTKGWSAVRTFRTALPPPVLNTPANGADLPNRRPAFDWEDVAGATGYTLQVSKNEAFTQVVKSASTVASAYAPTADLSANTTLWWRVQAKGANGPSLWSASPYPRFHTANPPGIPTLVAPALNALTRNYKPLLDWSNVTVPAGAPAFDHYRVQVDDDADFSSPVIDQDVPGPATNSSYTPGSDLASNTKYYWRVSSYNIDGDYSAWSAVRYFRTALLPPVLTSPADGVDVPSRRPAFDWEDVAGATGYTLQVSKNVTFTQVVKSVSTVASTYTPTADLPASTTLYWRVQSKGANGPSAWSARSFRTAP